MKRTQKIKHVGKDARIVSVYANRAKYAEVQKRAKSVGMSASKYLLTLAGNDIAKGGPLNVDPHQFEAIDTTAIDRLEQSDEAYRSKGRKRGRSGHTGNE